MPPLDDPFYASLPTLSDAELCTYIEHYSHYKVEAVHAALAELRTRGVYVSDATVAEIDRYFTRHEPQCMRPSPLAPPPPAMACVWHLYPRHRPGRVALHDCCCSLSFSAGV